MRRTRTKGKLDQVREEDVLKMLNELGKQAYVAKQLDVAETTLGTWLKTKGIKPVTRWIKEEQQHAG